VGESVSNGTLWDTRQPPKGNLALPSMGALFGGFYNTPPIRGTSMDNTVSNLEQKESSAVWDSEKGSCSEPLGGAAGQNPERWRKRKRSSGNGASLSMGTLLGEPVGGLLCQVP
jgi:hypothetical protein